MHGWSLRRHGSEHSQVASWALKAAPLIPFNLAQDRRMVYMAEAETDSLESMRKINTCIVCLSGTTSTHRWVYDLNCPRLSQITDVKWARRDRLPPRLYVSVCDFKAILSVDKIWENEQLYAHAISAFGLRRRAKLWSLVQQIVLESNSLKYTGNLLK